MIFLDSSFLIGFEVENDTNHAKARGLMHEIVEMAYGPAVISDYIFDEVVTVTFARTKSISKARLVGDAMLKSFRMLRVGEDVFQPAWSRFKAQKGTKFSFTDVTTAELMHQNSIRTIATFDREFKQSTEFSVLGTLP
jgi:predicted nucleic acid-binding protein